jgi:UPF0716 family protein affecting phage T7 exclusion
VIVGDMNKSLTRSIGFWLLLVLSLAATAVGSWLISGQLATMTTTLTDGTATGVEVYVGQSLVVVGAVLLGAGIIGFLLVLGLTAVQALLPAPTPAVAEPIDWAAHESPSETDAVTSDAATNDVDTTTDQAPLDDTDEDQNGSSGSTATATKISVK